VSALSPSTSEHVRVHARERPGTIALIANGREIDYSTFHRDLRKFTAALRRFGLPRLSVVAGTIASIDEKGIATLYPGVEAQITDARGVPVAAGQEGRLRIRTALLVDGYVDNPEATARAFRDGWFHTEDAAMMLPGGQVKLLGRGDDMLNVGGVKLEPSTIEESVSRAISLVDVAATSVANADGIEEICIAVVLEDPSKLREYSARIAHCVPQDCGQVHIRAVPSIPRTAETGKVRRGELKKVFSGRP
jgi:acyl-coenzyme A synthetase/AMP-(fatty) acid ligase